MAGFTDFGLIWIGSMVACIILSLRSKRPGVWALLALAILVAPSLLPTLLGK